MTNKIIKFIYEFKQRYPKELEDTFYNGYCYYFAVMLTERFGGTIYFNEELCHFGAYISDRLYDINGEISDVDYSWWEWNEYKQFYPSIAKEVTKSCIIKERKQ